MYRHPQAQFGDAKNSYRKAYDMYSLGVALLEIAWWEPLEVILGIRDVRKIHLADLRGIHPRLLGLPSRTGRSDDSAPGVGGSEYLSEVARKFGDSYRDIVELCLNASEVENETYKGEAPALIKSRLRIMFKQQVVDKLRLMKEVLGGCVTRGLG